MTRDEARKKAKGVFLGYVIMGIAPFFLLQIFFGIILTRMLFDGTGATLSYFYIGLTAIVFWGAVTVSQYRKGINNPEK